MGQGREGVSEGLRLVAGGRSGRGVLVGREVRQGHVIECHCRRICLSATCDWQATGGCDVDATCGLLGEPSPRKADHGRPDEKWQSDLEPHMRGRGPLGYRAGLSWKEHGAKSDPTEHHAVKRYTRMGSPVGRAAVKDRVFTEQGTHGERVYYPAHIARPANDWHVPFDSVLADIAWSG